jgi:hypothetical protein
MTRTEVAAQGCFRFWRYSSLGRWTVICGALLLLPGSLISQTSDKLDGLILRMEQAQKLRLQQLRAYEGVQTLEAIMGSDVKAALSGVLSYKAPDRMQFQPTEESGSSFLRNRVLQPILERELSSMQPEQRRKLAMSRENYRFTLVKDASREACGCYVLGVTPLHKSDHGIRGQIWVDATDFGIRHMDGYLVSHPSFWVRSVHVVRDYTRVGQFWMPTFTHSENQVLLFGRTDVDLRTDYARVQVSPPLATASATAESAVAHARPAAAAQ